jgi:RNA polymerase sigma-70 factor, ECF subfamily
MIDFEELYARHARDVFRFAHYLSGNRHDAEDITSETFVRAWTSPESIRVATVKAYLFTIARNLFLQGLRKKRRQVELNDGLREPQAGPEAQAEQRSELDAVLKKLQTLPEVDRAALLMRAMEEVPYEEIAQALGISLASAKVKVHRARRALWEIRDEEPK